MKMNMRINAFDQRFVSHRPLAVCAIIMLSAAWSSAGPAGKISRTAQPLPALDMTLVETTVINNTDKAVDVGHVSAADASIDSKNDDDRYRALQHKDATWHGSTFWSGPDWTRVGKDWQHPGTNTPSVRRFVAPLDGRVTIGGRVFKGDTSKKGDGVRLIIRHGNREAWRAEIGSSDSKGVEPHVTLDVKRGDSIRFIVHKIGHIGYDTTHWDPVVTYANGTRFQASTAFDPKRQGHGNWHYEMDAKDSTAAGSASLYCFDKDLNLCRRSIGPNKPVVCDSRTSLPLLIVKKTGSDCTCMAVDPAGAWRCRFSLAANGDVNTELLVPEGGKSLLEAGQSLRLPSVIRGSFNGKWSGGLARFERLLGSKSGKPGVEQMRRKLVESVEQAMGRYTGNTADAKVGSFEFLAMVQIDWLEQDKLLDAISSAGDAAALHAQWKKAAQKHIEKVRLLLADLRGNNGSPDFLADEAKRLDEIEKQLKNTDADSTAGRELYLRLRGLKREIVLANPLMNFGPLLFCKRVPTSYSHLVMQYYGWRARPGGGLFVLDNPGRSSACHDILAGKLCGGSVLEPRLSYDGKRIVFSYVEHAGVDQTGKKFDQYKVINDADDGFYHIYEVNVDGSGLRQLTSGTYDDMMPTYLPDGGIAFCSTRRRGYARCFGWGFSRRWHVYTLHRMDADGKNLRTLSMHDTNEWFPTVDHSGKILYSRWDYIDRDAVTHQNLWSTRPDGTNPIAVWGNGSPKPHCTFQIQPIPGSNKIVFTAAPHHSIAAGPIAMVDPTVSDNGQEAITRVTPEIPFPEAETRDIREYYTAPWPLSEKYFLVGYCPTPLVWEPGANDPAGLGLYVLDIFGNREFIYRDAAIGSTNPCPLVARTRPPVLASDLPQNASQSGEMILADVYAGLGDIPRGSIKKLRVVQIFPKATHLASTPPIGVAGEENARAILGTVPVEPDGSARFTVPAATPLLFQALDENGFAYQTMRTLTYVQPGERVSCVGCHENRMTAPVQSDVAALRRAPSTIDPGVLGGRPFSYVQVVQPILNKHCISCHGDKDTAGGMNLTGKPEGKFSKSYNALCLIQNPDKRDPQTFVPRFERRNQIQITPPGGRIGAIGSGLMKMLREGHEDVQLSDEEMRRLATWIDMNAVFYGVYKLDKQRRELGGEVFPLPELK